MNIDETCKSLQDAAYQLDGAESALDAVGAPVYAQSYSYPHIELSLGGRIHCLVRQLRDEIAAKDETIKNLSRQNDALTEAAKSQPLTWASSVYTISAVTDPTGLSYYRVDRLAYICDRLTGTAHVCTILEQEVTPAIKGLFAKIGRRCPDTPAVRSLVERLSRATRDRWPM